MKSGGVWKKYRSMESFDRELIGEQREEKKTMSGSSIKMAYEKLSSKRKRSEKNVFDNSKKSRTSESMSHFGHTGSLETPSSGENLQMNTDDKENQNRSIIDDILAEHPMEVMNEDPFDPSANHKSVSTPLKILSPNKRLTMETPDKIGFNSPKASPAFKNRIIKNLDAENSFEPPSGALPRVNIMRLEIPEPVTEPEQKITEQKIEEKENPSTSKIPRPTINKDLFNTPTKTPQKTLQKNSPFGTPSPTKKSFHQHSTEQGNSSNM